MSKIIVQAVQTWEIKDENRTGLTVNYIDPKLMSDDKTIGLKPLRATLEAKDIRLFPTVPGVYEAEFGMKANGKGKVELVLIDAKFLKPFEFKVD